MKLHRDLGIGQEAAWYMGHRIRGMWGKEEDKFAGPVEADETYIGGLGTSMSGRNRNLLVRRRW